MGFPPLRLPPTLTKKQLALPNEIERSRKFIVLQNPYTRRFKIGGSYFLPTARTKQAHTTFNI